MQHEHTELFFKARLDLAVNHTPSKEEVDMHRQMDRQRNPHNDSYKPPIRSEKELISDLKFRFADAVLVQQFGHTYENWLQRNATQDPHTKDWRAGGPHHVDVHRNY